MKFCIVGAGAIGGFVAARLARAGHDIALVARGPHLAALKRDGITVVEADGTRHTHRVEAYGHATEAGPADVVLLTLKAMQLGAMAADIPRLFHRDTVVVPMQNGVPWWYFQRHGGVHEGLDLTTVDPSGALARAIPAERIVGCVVYPASEIVSPGVVHHVEGERLPLGELDGSVTPRVEAISQAFQSGGLKAPVLTDIRSEIWLKLWGNLTFNPLSALTRATLDRICAEPLTRELAAAMMTEAALVAGRLGISFRMPIDRRIEGASKVRGHKTSMLQDIEAGRPTELDPLLGSVIELARLTGSDVPNIRAVYACTRLLEATVRH